MAWTANQIWRWTHISFATLWLSELLFGAVGSLLEALFGSSLLEREVLGLPFDDGLFLLLLLPVTITGFAKWPLYPWYKKRQSKSGGKFKFIGPWNGNQIWRWIHIGTGSLWILLLGDGLFLDGLIFGDEEEESLLLTITFLIAFFGTIISGLAKWPIYPWYKKRKNRKARAAKAAAGEEE